MKVYGIEYHREITKGAGGSDSRVCETIFVNKHDAQRSLDQKYNQRLRILGSAVTDKELEDNRARIETKSEYNQWNVIEFELDEGTS